MRRLLAWLFILAGLGGWVLGAQRDGLFSEVRRGERAVLAAAASQAGRDMALERRLAEAYWSREPDVARDSHYGREGPLGVLGAREHWDQHGRREGRRWGPDP